MKAVARNNRAGEGAGDLLAALAAPQLWWFLGWQDIRQRYRRSVLGPLWLTLSTGIQIGTLGFLWAEIFGQKVHDFLPFFAVGLVCWTMLSGVVVEACTGFTQFEAIIRQIRLPMSSFLLRVMCRHFIIFLHNLLIIVAVFLVLRRPLHPEALLFLPGMVLLCLFSFLAAGPIAVFCTRFRDMPQIVSNLVNILYYLTPIMWVPATLHSMSWVYQYNPLHHALEVVRGPLMGSLPTAVDYAWVVGAIALLAAAYLSLLGRYRHRIAYWI